MFAILIVITTFNLNLLKIFIIFFFFFFYLFNNFVNEFLTLKRIMEREIPPFFSVVSTFKDLCRVFSPSLSTIATKLS
jgi:hypothetical protein